MKDLAFRVVRFAHRRLLSGDLPPDVAVYFHELGRPQWDAFARAMDYFRTHEYACVPPSRFATERAEGKRLFVSFDDNFADWHRALGLLERLGVKATFYVNTMPFRDVCCSAELSAYFRRIGYSGSSSTLSRTELKEIAAAGHNIGCHSHSHFKLSALPRERWQSEISDSKHRLEDLIGRPVRDFSYPYGMRRHFSSALRAYCADLGFTTIATGIPGLQQAAGRDPLNIHRAPWNLSRSLEENLANLGIDGRAFERLTGRSAVG